MDPHTQRHRLAVLPSGLVFGSLASLGNNIAVSIAFLLINILYAYVLMPFLGDTFSAAWVIDVLLLTFAAVLGIVGIWLGVRFAHWGVKREHVVPDLQQLPFIGTAIFLVPIVLWLALQLINDLLYAGTINWMSMGYLGGQVLIFGGASYLLLLRYVRAHHALEAEHARLVKTDFSMKAVIIAFLTVIGMGATILTAHAVEATLMANGSVLGLTEGFFASNAALIGACLAVALVSFGAAYALCGHRSVWTFLAELRRLPLIEYLLAAFSFAAGVVYAFGFGLKAYFLFTPYAGLLVTFAVLLGIAASALMSGHGRRDRAFTISRVVAYLVGFVSQPTILNSIVSILMFLSR